MKDLTACYNLLTTLYSYAFQLREEIVEIESTIFDTRTMMLDFYDKIPEDEHFSILVRNMKDNLEKINQIFISNEHKFKHWISQDKINLFECDFLLKQQKDVLEKEYQKHEYLISCFDEEHHEAMEFWNRWFGECKFVDKIHFFEVYQREYGKINPKTVDVMNYYIDFNRDGLVSVYKFYKFLNYFGNFKMFVGNIESLIQKDIYIFSISSIKANPKLKNSKSGTYLLRFSKSHSNCFAISFKNEKSQIKQFLISCFKKGLRLKNSEKIYPNLSEFISANSNALRYNLDKDKLGVDMNNYQIDLNQEILNVNKSFLRARTENRSFCNHCKISLTDSV